MNPLIFVFVLAVTLMELISAWSTHYSSDMVYMHLKSNELLSIPLDAKLELSSIVSKVSTLATPAVNSTLCAGYPSNNTANFALYSFGGLSCQKPLTVSEFSADKNAWVEITSTQDYSFFTGYNIFSYKGSEIIYLFGGYCGDSTNSNFGSVSDNILAFNTTSNSFFTPPNKNSPLGFYSAGSVNVADSSVLLIGGKAAAGWIGMSQLALYDVNTWEYKSPKNATSGDFRMGPLVLPSFSTGGTVYQCLILDGLVNKPSALPYLSVLSLNSTTGWTWSPPGTTDLNQDLIIGGATLYNTLFTVESSSSSSTSGSKRSLEERSSSYVFNLYDTATWQSVKNISPDSSSSTSSSTNGITGASSSSNKMSTGNIAALSTVLPIAAICIIAGLYLFFRRRRVAKKRRNLLTSPNISNNDISNFFYPENLPNSSSMNHEAQESESIHSWQEKRQRYERTSKLFDTSPFSSAGSAGNDALGIKIDNMGSRNEDLAHLRNLEMGNNNNDMFTQRPLSLPKGSDDIADGDLLNSGYMAGSERNTSPEQRPSLRFGVNSSFSNHRTNNSESSVDDLFYGREVQVLVSSLRRNKLRITNPDENASPGNSRSNTIKSYLGRTNTLKTFFSRTNTMMSAKSSNFDSGREVAPVVDEFEMQPTDDFSYQAQGIIPSRPTKPYGDLSNNDNDDDGDDDTQGNGILNSSRSGSTTKKRTVSNKSDSRKVSSDSPFNVVNDDDLDIVYDSHLSTVYSIGEDYKHRSSRI